MRKYGFLVIAMLSGFACTKVEKTDLLVMPEPPFIWSNANTYFLITDRFNNGNPDNDINFARNKETSVLRGFEGGDFNGITQKINEGYFDKLGINSIWFSPIAEQTRGIVDEGTGPTYGYHGYWITDWTSIEPNFGTDEDLKELVETAHEHGIRVLIDIILNHTGPVTVEDPLWPESWVRTEPTCTFSDYESTVTCTLVKNLPDIKTESNDHVELPEILKTKWQEEGRLEKEMAELDAFFKRTGHPKAPRYYIIKWLTDIIRKYGVDGFRVDTAKHAEEAVWAELFEEATKAFNEWKQANPDKVLDNNDFFMVGEVYNYSILDSTQFDFGDKTVNYFANGFTSLINFNFKSLGDKSYEEIFSQYSDLLNGPLSGKTVLNYISSHDDGEPYDKFREDPIDAGTKLLLCPGGSQVYYGDESSRLLDIEGTEGDATLRSNMNWTEIDKNAQRNGYKVQDVLSHWQKLGIFRKIHPSVGAGVHSKISDTPYLFKRSLSIANYDDNVIVGLDLDKGLKTIDVSETFINGAIIKDYYSGQELKVVKGEVTFNSEFTIVLLGN